MTKRPNAMSNTEINALKDALKDARRNATKISIDEMELRDNLLEKEESEMDNNDVGYISFREPWGKIVKKEE